MTTLVLLTDTQRKRYYALKKTATRTAKEDLEYKTLKKLRNQEKSGVASSPIIQPPAPVIVPASALADIEEARALVQERKAPKAKKFLDEMCDPEAMVRQLVAAGLDVDALENELGDLPVAANVIEFVRDPRFLHYNSYAWQMKILVELFAEWCTECSDRAWFEEIGPVGSTRHMPLDISFPQFLDKVQLYQHGICPSCKGRRTDQHGAQKLPYELVACVGQRAGKSILVGIISNYVLHRFLCMRNPQRTYQTVPGQPMYMTFAAKTMTQAQQTLWDAFSSAHIRAPWFGSYHEMLKSKAAQKGIDPTLLYDVKKTFVWYGTKMITVQCEASDGGTMRGRTRIMAAIDELAFFAQGDTKKANGPETYEALKNALYTVRAGADASNGIDPNILQGLMLNVSSPSSAYDPLMTLLKESRHDERVVRFHKATWEVNPIYTRETLKGEERKNYAQFMRNFGAVPPLSDCPFLDNEPLIDRCIMDGTNGKPLLQPHIKTQPEIVTDAIGGKYIGVKLLSFTPGPYPYVIACDAGESGNHFGVGLYHLEPGDETCSEYVRVAGLVDLAPEKDEGTGDTFRIHFPSVFNLIVELASQCQVLMVLYDRWASTGERQRLGEKKIPHEMWTASGADFQAIRARVNSGGLRIPCREKVSIHDLHPTSARDLQSYPYAHLDLQLRTVRESGTKVTKPLQGEDDLFRTLVLANAYLEENREKFLVAANPNAKNVTAWGLGNVYLPGGGSRGGSRGTGSADPSLGLLRSKRYG